MEALENPIAAALIPRLWRALVDEINGGRIPSYDRIPDGEPGIRDVDARCDAFEPVGAPYEIAKGNGNCQTDGHYLCVECVHIELGTLRRRRDQCEECGATLPRGRNNTLGDCPNGCHVPLWALMEQEEARRRQAVETALAEAVERRRVQEQLVPMEWEVPTCGRCSGRGCPRCQRVGFPLAGADAGGGNS